MNIKHKKTQEYCTTTATTAATDSNHNIKNLKYQNVKNAKYEAIRYYSTT